MNYYKIRENRLLKAYAYDKKKKELINGQKENNNKERCEEEKTATKL